MQYAPTNQYNYNETSFYYKMISNHSLTTQQHASIKKENMRITIHYAYSATRSYKLLMQIINKYKQLQCFRVMYLKSVESLRVKQHINKKAQIVIRIIVKQLRQFNNLIASYKVILLLDNFSIYKCTVVELKALLLGSSLINTKICQLLLNLISKLQLLD